MNKELNYIKCPNCKQEFPEDQTYLVEGSENVCGNCFSLAMLLKQGKWTF